MIRACISGVLALLVVGFGCPMVYGEGSRPGTTGASEEWVFPATVYLWAVGLDGNATVKGIDMEVSEGFGDIFDNLDVALEGHFELWKGRWGGMFDATYVKLSADANSGPVAVDLTQKYTLIDFGVLYRAGIWPMDKTSGETTGSNRWTTFDLLLGGRYTKLDMELEPQRLPKIEGDESWTDLIVGGRLITDLSEKWSLILRSDIGGFGISGSTDFTLNGIVLFAWRFHPKWMTLVGYRALYQDYETGSGADKFKYDITTHGPILGLTYRF